MTREKGEEERKLEPDLSQTSHIREVSKILIRINQKLTGTRSTMHYLVDSVNVLVKKIMPFEECLIVWLEEWEQNPGSVEPIEALQQLDISKESIRDHDKSVIVRKNML